MIELVSAEDADLPRAQRHTQRELGELVGASEATVGRELGTRSGRTSSDAGSDLAGNVIDAEVIEAARAEREVKLKNWNGDKENETICGHRERQPRS